MNAQVAGYVIRGGRPGAHRLQVLARSLGPGTTTLFDEIGIGAGARCLDLGCGPGDVVLELARRAGVDGVVTGVDADGSVLELARERAAAAGLQNVRFVRASLDALPHMVPQDVVYSRNVVQHLAAPVDAIATMWRLVAPGGVLVAEDADFPGVFCHPPDAAIDFWVERYSRVLRMHGGDPESGRKLAARFVAAGTPSPDVRIVQRVYLGGEGKLMPYLTLCDTADTMIAGGVATAAEIARAALRLREIADDPSVLVGTPRIVQAWVRRPGLVAAG
jgi:SAM-dependent methyltransferase